MNYRFWLPILFGCLLILVTTTVASAAPEKVIFDTDIAPDVDDVGTAAVLNALIDTGEAEAIAMGISSKNLYAPACLKAINVYYGHENIPIGAPKGDAPEDKSKYTEAIAAAFPTNIKTANDAPEVIKVYRKALAAAPDGSVNFVTVGYLNNAATLLKSGPDQHSPLSGKELIAKKVKQWVCMGAKIPKGREWNIHRDAPGAVYSIENWPTKIVFSGYEIGSKIGTGARLKSTPKDSPVRLSYEKYNGLKNRWSWDQTTLYYAIRGLDNLWNLSKEGYCEILPDGSNIWHADIKRNQYYLIEKRPPAEVAKVIEDLMVRQPKNKK
jgi:hypothetical protein